jgi:mRNA interferase MazF
MPDIQWLIIEADLDPVMGNEQSDRRPVIIISNEEFNQVMPNVTVVPLTSTRHLYPAEVLITKGTAGLPLESIVLAHQIRTISKQRLGRVIGRLDDSELREEVRGAIKEHLDLDTPQAVFA